MTEIDTKRLREAALRGEDAAIHALLDALEQARAARAEAEARAAQYQKERAELSDKLNGTPCAEIRWRHERDELRAARAKAEARIGELEALIEKRDEAGLELCARLEAADGAIQKAAMSLGSTDEWTDQGTMIADFEERLAAHRDAKMRGEG